MVSAKHRACTWVAPPGLRDAHARVEGAGGGLKLAARGLQLGLELAQARPEARVGVGLGQGAAQLGGAALDARDQQGAEVRATAGGDGGGAGVWAGVWR